MEKNFTARMLGVKNDVFLDTSHVIAMCSPQDELHRKSLLLAEQIEVAGRRLVTTEAVLLEVGNSLSRRRFRRMGVQILHSLTKDARITVEQMTSDFFFRGFELYEARMDKEWGLVDCVSFIVMKDRGLTEALTSDEHFEQAGFVALLRN